MVVPILIAGFGCKYEFTECPVACVEFKTGDVCGHFEVAM